MEKAKTKASTTAQRGSGPVKIQNRVNDMFWEQFLAVRPGCSDTEEANHCEEQEERKSMKGVAGNTKGTLMDSPAFRALKDEVTKGLDQAKQQSASTTGDHARFLERTLTSYEEALSILNEIGSMEPGSSAEESTSKRRRQLSWRVVQGFDVDDGYEWRKYGQKDILNAEYPRSYYRCIHRHNRGCMAVKQVQRLGGDPNQCNVAYRGEHTCTRPTAI